MGAPSRPLRLAIVNDYPVVVAGLRSLLGRHPDRISVVELSCRMPVTSDVDVVLVDSFADVPRGFRGLPALVEEARSSGAKVVVFSWDTDASSVRRALAQGAVGYLAKSLPPDELVEALARIRAGEVVTDLGEQDSGRSTTARPDASGAWPSRELGLTSRESEVIALISKGLSNDEIAATLFLGINTIKTYIRTAYRKMGVSRRSQAVLWALEHDYALAPRRVTTDGAHDETETVGEPLRLEPIPETVAAVEEFGPFTAGDDDLLVQLRQRADQVQALVPQCVGLTLASLDAGVSFTLVATSAEIAALDAVQYLSGGPCVDAAKAEQVLHYDENDLLDELQWQHFAAATSAAGVASTLSLPVVGDGTVVGTVNLYASTADAFDGHHEAVADVFGAWAPGAATNADLSFATRRLAELAPAQLRDDIDLQVATGMVATQEAVDLDQARARLDDAARRARVGVAQLARVVIDAGRLQD